MRSIHYYGGLIGQVKTSGTDSGIYNTTAVYDSKVNDARPSITFDYLVVAGGGSSGTTGGAGGSGGGGAGGLLSGSGISPTGTYTVTVGGGGLHKLRATL